MDILLNFSPIVGQTEVFPMYNIFPRGDLSIVLKVAYIF